MSHTERKFGTPMAKRTRQSVSDVGQVQAQSVTQLDKYILGRADNADHSENANALAELQASTNDIEEFNLDGQVHLAKCVNVYDGDTCKVVFWFGGELTKWTIRLYGIDTPELRGVDADTKKKGLAARDRLRELALDKLVTVEVITTGKYGRLVCRLFDAATHDKHTKSFNMMLVDEGHGVPYMADPKLIDTHDWCGITH